LLSLHLVPATALVPLAPDSAAAYGLVEDREAWINPLARSIMAEAVLERVGGARFNACSAGSAPAKQPMPEVVDRLRQLGHDVTRLRCEFTGPDAPRMDFVIALCDTPQGQTCPGAGREVR